MGKQVWFTYCSETKQFSRTKILPDPVYITDREMSCLLEGFHHMHSGGPPGVLVTYFLASSGKGKNHAVFDLPKSPEVGGLI